MCPPEWSNIQQLRHNNVRWRQAREELGYIWAVLSKQDSFFGSRKNLKLFPGIRIPGLWCVLFVATGCWLVEVKKSPIYLEFLCNCIWHICTSLYLRICGFVLKCICIICRLLIGRGGETTGYLRSRCLWFIVRSHFDDYCFVLLRYLWSPSKLCQLYVHCRWAKTQLAPLDSVVEPGRDNNC